MRLIDADKFIKWLDVGHLRDPSEVCLNELNVLRMIIQQPTAYDVGKVIEQLEDYGKHKGLLRITDNPTNCDNYVPVREVKKIVKGAVKNEYISSNNYNSISNNPNN